LKPDYVTKIGKFDIPVVNAKFATVVTFRRGRLGKVECGTYLFWTVVLKKKSNGIEKTCGRSYAYLDAGERFRRVDVERLRVKSKADRKIYQRMWDAAGAGKNIKHIRPSTQMEVRRWMASHEEDAEGLMHCYVGGQSVSV
jgi:hypothetical protein